jgi:hypothetical protein
VEYPEIAELWDALPPEANIYQTAPTLDPVEAISELAARIGFADFSPKEWQHVGELSRIRRGPHVLTLFRPSGAVQYVDSARWQTDDGVSTLEVSDEAAARAALAEVDRLSLRGSDEFRLDRVTRLYAACGTVGAPPSSPRVIDAAVVLTRVIDGLAVDGRGGSIILYLDHELSPTGFERVARPIVSVRSRVDGWRGVDEVLNDVTNYWTVAKNYNITVTDVRLVFYEFGRMNIQEVIQPAFRLDLTIQHVRGDDTHTVRHYEPAAKNSIGSLMPT